MKVYLGWVGVAGRFVGVWGKDGVVRDILLVDKSDWRCVEIYYW